MNCIKRWWISGRIIGMAKMFVLYFLQKILHFGEWHIRPVNRKTYAIDIINALDSNRSNKRIAVEVGCGLGSIIGNLKVGGGQIRL